MTLNPFFAISDDTLNIVLNYLPTDVIYKLKSLNKQLNNFIDNQLILENYYCNILNINIIGKHKINLKKIIIHGDESNIREFNDQDLMGLNKLDTFILPNNINITDKGLKYIHNVQHLNLYYNSNITNEGLKCIPNVRHLELKKMKI